MNEFTNLQKASEAIRVLGETIEQVKSSEDPTKVKDYLDKVAMARAWAKLKDRIDETRAVLLRLELECFIRLHELGGGHLVHGSLHVMNYIYSQKDALDGLLARYPDAATAKQLYTAHIRETKVQAGMDFARKGYRREKYKEEDAIIAAAIDFQSEKQAIAFLLDRYAAEGNEFTVPEMADDFIAMVTEPGDTVSEAFTEGIRSVCRQAVNKGGWEEMGKKKVPRFVTCFEESTQKIIRVPFEYATLAQLKEMIIIRSKSLAAFEEAVKNLELIYNELAGSVPQGRDPDSYQIKTIIGCD